MAFQIPLATDDRSDVFQSDDSLKERRLIIIGKTGNGRSSVGNLLLGTPHFRVGFSMTSTTVRAASGTASFRGWKIKVLDTPDISNMGLLDEDEAQKEISMWKALTSPKAHAILLAVRCDVRYTREEHEIFLRLKKLWGGQSLSRRLIVAFTFGDRQDTDIREDLKRVCPELKSVLKEASQRYLLFNDHDSQQRKADLVITLMQMVDKMDAEVLKAEERRLMMGVQVCPMGPLSPQQGARHPFMRSISEGSTTSGGGEGRNLRRTNSGDTDCIRLLLVGKPGTGKSSTGNTILGRDTFPLHHCRTGITIHASRKGEVDINGKLVQVIDTPGLQTDPQDPESYQRESRRAWQLVAPGPHALLYVVRQGHVTREDLRGFRTLKEGLGQGLSHHTMVVLVGGPLVEECRVQRLERVVRREEEGGGRPQEEGFEVVGDGVPSSTTQPGSPEDQDHNRYPDNPELSLLLQEAGGKVWTVSHMVGEKEDKKGGRERQVNVLMDLVRGILNNSGGNCFVGDQTAREASEKRERDKGEKRSSCWFL